MNGAVPADLPLVLTADTLVFLVPYLAVAVLFGRVAAPAIAALFADQPPTVRAGLDALLGVAVVVAVVSVRVFEPLPRLGAGGVAVLAVVWGARLGTRPSGGVDDLTDGKARILGAVVGLLASAVYLFGTAG